MDLGAVYLNISPWFMAKQACKVLPELTATHDDSTCDSDLNALARTPWFLNNVLFAFCFLVFPSPTRHGLNVAQDSAPPARGEGFGNAAKVDMDDRRASLTLADLAGHMGNRKAVD